MLLTLQEGLLQISSAVGYIKTSRVGIEVEERYRATSL